jgi:hypothetical protein
VSERLLAAAAIVERLGVPKTWVLESARSSAMPCLRLGRYVRFELDDGEAWLVSCKRPGRPIALRGREGVSVTGEGLPLAGDVLARHTTHGCKWP